MTALKKLLAMGLTALLLLGALTGCGSVSKDLAEYIDRGAAEPVERDATGPVSNAVGVIEGDTFTNDTFGVTLTLGDGWRFCSDREVRELGYSSDTYVAAFSEATGQNIGVTITSVPGVIPDSGTIVELFRAGYEKDPGSFLRTMNIEDGTVTQETAAIGGQELSTLVFEETAHENAAYGQMLFRVNADSDRETTDIMIIVLTCEENKDQLKGILDLFTFAPENAAEPSVPAATEAPTPEPTPEPTPTPTPETAADSGSNTLGVIEGNTFTIDSFGLSFTLGDGWRFYSEEELREKDLSSYTDMMAIREWPLQMITAYVYTIPGAYSVGELFNSFETDYDLDPEAFMSSVGEDGGTMTMEIDTIAGQEVLSQFIESPSTVGGTVYARNMYWINVDKGKDTTDVMMITLRCSDDKAQLDDMLDMFTFAPKPSVPAATEAPTPEPAADSVSNALGVITGNTFTSDSFGLSFTLGDGWRFYSEKELQAMGETGDTAVWAVSGSSTQSISLFKSSLQGVYSSSQIMDMITSQYNADPKGYMQKNGMDGGTMTVENVTVGGQKVPTHFIKIPASDGHVIYERVIYRACHSGDGSTGMLLINLSCADNKDQLKNMWDMFTFKSES